MKAFSRRPWYWPMSAPAAKAFSPAPVRMTMRTSGSAAASSSAALSSSSSAVDSAFSFSGRLSVTIPTPISGLSNRTSAMGLALHRAGGDAGHELALEEEEDHDDRQRHHDRARHQLAVADAVLPDIVIHADRKGAHLFGRGEREGEEELLPRHDQHEDCGRD